MISILSLQCQWLMWQEIFSETKFSLCRENVKITSYYTFVLRNEIRFSTAQFSLTCWKNFICFTYSQIELLQFFCSIFQKINHGITLILVTPGPCAIHMQPTYRMHVSKTLVLKSSSTRNWLQSKQNATSFFKGSRNLFHYLLLVSACFPN